MFGRSGKLFWALCVCAANFSIPRASNGEVVAKLKYTVASRPVAGRGNHRAIVRVTEKADAVWVRIPWRRCDPQPETKDVRIFDAATGKRITNVVRVSIRPEYGDLVFQPATVPGIYEVYYLPYEPPRKPMPGEWWRKWYYKP